MKKLLAIAFAMSMSNVFAAGLISSNDTYNTNTPVATAGASANQGQAQGQQQGQGQAQGQYSVNTNANLSSNVNLVEGSKAQAASASNSGATSGSQAIGDVSVSTVTNEAVAASSAAAVMVASCQQGGSGSSLKGGLGFASDSPQCAALRQAAIDLERASLYASVGDVEKAKEAMASYEANVKQAEESQNFRQVFGNIGGFVIDLLPVAALAFLL